MIRHATTLDLDAIVEFVQEFYPNTHYAQQASFDIDTVRDLTEYLIKSGIVLLATVDDELVGIIAAAVRPHLFNSTELSCHEVIWYVTPAHQKSGLGVALIERADQIRLLRGCKAFQMMRLDGSPSHIDKLFLSLNFQPSEYCFTKVN